MTDDTIPVKYVPTPPVEHRWKKGQSGNPSGRAKGFTKAELAVEAKVQEAAQLHLACDAKKMLNRNAGKITQEVLKIALLPADRVEAVDKKTGVKTVTMVYGQAKVKCLLACFERIIPSLKVVEIKEDGPMEARAMSDDQIVELMTRMVNLAQGEATQIDG